MELQSPLRARLLGPLQFSWNGQPVEPRSRKALALLLCLALRPAGASRSELAELLWKPGKSGSVRQALYELRKLPGASGWLAGGDPVRASIESDLQVFEAAVTEERYDQALEVWPGQDASRLDPAALWQGLEPESSSAFLEWLELERVRVGTLYMDSLQCRALELEQAQDFDSALSLARKLAAHDPLNETAHRLMMRLHYLQGRPEAGLDQYAVCRRILKEELGVEPLGETRELAREIEEHLEVRRTATGSESVPPMADERRLLPSATPFIGRNEEITDIGRALKDPACRLLTLTGPGGIGKSRLALEAAHRMGAEMGTVHFVPLASVGSPELVVSAIAGRLGLTFGDLEDARSQLLRTLGKQRLLLVLDNFEHLLAGAYLLADILAGAPGVTLLVTSRERLNLAAEWLYELRGLRYPKRTEYAEASSYDALRLFSESARRVRFDFRLGGQTTFQVARICRLLQGVPLGLELAAAWTRLLPCEAIADELEETFDLLWGRNRDGEASHRSIRVVFDRSWQRLAPDERQAFTRLAVFRGGFAREAAREAANVPLHMLLRLMDKSLLTCNRPGRFAMLEVVRQYGLEKLAETPELMAEALKAHCRYYSALLEAGLPSLEGSDAKSSLANVTEDLDNFRTSWRHAAESGWATELSRATRALSTYYDLKGLFEEGVAAFGLAAAGLAQAKPATEAGKLTLAELWLRESWFLFRLGRYGDAQGLLEQSLVLFRHQRQPLGIASCLYQLGNVAEALGDYERAQRLLREALATFRQAGQHQGELKTLNSLGLVAYALGDYGEARRLHMQGLPLREEQGDPRALMIGLNNLGDATLRLGDSDGAGRLYLRALNVSRDSGDTWGVALSQCHLGDAAFARRAFAEAEGRYREAVALCEDIGMSYALAIATRGLGRARAASGDHREAVALLRRSLGIAAAIDATPQTLETLAALAQLRRRQGELDGSLALCAVVLEHGGRQAYAMDLAKDLMEELRSDFAPETVAAARRQVQTQRLEDIVGNLLDEASNPISTTRF